MRSRLGCLAALVAIGVCLSSARPAAWGADGHHIIARIAWALSSEEVRHQAQAILGDEDFVKVSTWADDIRRDHPETSNWHFVDIPYGDTRYDPAIECKPTAQGDCLLAELTRAQAVLADTHASSEARRDALKYVIHFVGDLHQPLHDIDNHDRGGNDVHVVIAGKLTNLHSVWDSGILRTRGLTEDVYAAALLDDMKVHPVPDDGVDYLSWALDAHRIAVQEIYTYAGFSSAGPPGASVEMTEAYEQSQLAVIERQLELAGARLARVLKVALTP